MNHFPNGVFQNCRTILVREREIEREKIRKAKRMKKSQNALRSKSNVSMIVPIDSDLDWDGTTIRAMKSAPVLSSIDPFDVAWSQALNGTGATAHGGFFVASHQSDVENGDESEEKD